MTPPRSSEMSPENYQEFQFATTNNLGFDKLERENIQIESM